MRLQWQCPTCYAELGDRSYAGMLTCPYCGSLLIVNSKEKKFFRVPKDGGWYFFSKINSPGYIKYGNYEEHYAYVNRWYLLKDGSIYAKDYSPERKIGKCEILDEGKVEYIWGELPFVAPPKSVIKTAICEDGLMKIFPKGSIFFLKVEEEIPDVLVKILQGGCI